MALGPSHQPDDAVERKSWGFRDRARETPFDKSRAIELRYSSLLRKVAAEIGRIIDGYPDPLDDPTVSPLINASLAKYSEILTPWAETVGARMVAEVDRQDATAWNKHTRQMSRALRAEIASAPTGETMRRKLAEQVVLIKSLPIDAAERVHKLTLEGITQGTRASEIAKEIARSGQVSKSRATLIARTEVVRTATALTETRALHVGCTHFIWRSAGDSDVRPLHRKLNGNVFAFADPPVSDERTGIRSLPGAIWNCRCYPEPIVPDIDA